MQISDIPPVLGQSYATGVCALALWRGGPHERLIAVLVRLSDDNEVAPGQWFVEAGFGRLDGGNHPTFSHLDKAQDWISQRLAKER